MKGPDLDGVASRLTGSGLLESLIHPGAGLAKDYEGAAAGPPEEDASSRSPMPPVGTLLTLRELRDLMTYLRTLKDP